MRGLRTIFIGVAIVLIAATAAAHHASAPHFDRNRPIEIEGVITKFEFVNPHAYLDVDVTDTDGNVTNYTAK